jgi:hypothetical protein
MNNLVDDNYLTNPKIFELYKTAYLIYLDNNLFTPSFKDYINMMTQHDINEATLILRKLKIKEIFNDEI